MTAIDRLNASVLRAHGQTATVTVGGVPTQVDGVYTAPYEEIPVGNTLVSRRNHQLKVLSADWVAILGRPGATVELADGSTFTVVSAAPDHGGMTTLQMRAYG